MLISFLFLHGNICFGYSLEAPHRCFHGEIRKVLCGYPLLSVPMLWNYASEVNLRTTVTLKLLITTAASDNLILFCMCVCVFFVFFFCAKSLFSQKKSHEKKKEFRLLQFFLGFNNKTSMVQHLL